MEFIKFEKGYFITVPSHSADASDCKFTLYITLIETKMINFFPFLATSPPPAMYCIYCNALYYKML